MLPVVYNNNYQIFQAPGYVAIAIEMIHDVRIIPLDGRPHLPSNFIDKAQFPRQISFNRQPDGKPARAPAITCL
jgi:hypothetical protein